MRVKGKGSIMDRCEICRTVMREGFALCNSCGDKQKYWNEDTDTHHMLDGSRWVYRLKSGRYEHVK